MEWIAWLARARVKVHKVHESTRLNTRTLAKIESKLNGQDPT